MEPRQKKIVERIFHLYYQEKPEDIRKFVTREANNDPKVIEKVLALIAINDEKTFNNTQQPVIINQALNHIEEINVSNQKIDKYELLKKIGEGGMGTVYLARRKDKELEHYVAIKLINTSITTKSHIERFQKERQILANLDHENIARFLDAGQTESGVMYVVMEYIQGQALNQYNKEHSLSLKHKLDLFLQLCSAVDYAHKNLIVHRDIKPANILISKDRKIKLLDFGIAKLLDDNPGEMVQTVTKIMTPAYASPEQILGKPISVHSDVYTLGIVLFELVLGFRPFIDSENDLPSFHANILKGLVTKPSQMVEKNLQASKSLTSKANIPPDIDAILIKALNPDTKYRYQTVSELKTDIESYISGYPVKARKPNKFYFFKLFVRRNKLAVSLSAIAVFLVIGFSIFSYLQNKKLIERGQELEIQRDEAILQSKRARLASDFLLESFQTADPTRTLGANLTIKQVMEDSYNKLQSNPLDDAALNAELLLTISKAFFGMDQLSQAFESAQSGYKQAKAASNISPFLAVQFKLEIAKGYFVKRKFSRSIVLLKELVSECNKNSQDIQCPLDEIYWYLSKIQREMGNHTYAKESAELGIKWLEALNIKDIRLIKLLIILEGIEIGLEKPENTILIFERIQKLITLDENKPLESYYYLDAEVTYCLALSLTNQNEIALKKVENLILNITNNYGKNNVLYIRAISIHAHILKQVKQYDKSLDVYNEIINIKKSLNLSYHGELNKIGKVYFYFFNDYEKSIEYFLEAITLFKNEVDVITRNLGYYHRNIALAYFRVGSLKETLHHYQEANTIFKSVPFEDEADLIILLDRWIVYLEKEIKKNNGTN